MRLKRLKIKNIRSHKETEVEFPEGSTLLSGDIGSGKTSILLAIEFALFGLQPGQKGGSLLRNNETEAEVKLEFEVDENNVIIERTIKKSGKSLAQADISITINNDRFEGSVTEIKNKILSLLDYPPEFAKKTNDLYRFTVYTPQEEMKQIILESNDTRLNTLRHVFGIDKYKRIEENVDIFTARLRQEIRVKEAEIGNIDIKKQQITEKTDTLIKENECLKSIEKEITEIEKIKLEKQIEIEEFTKKMSEKNKLENEKEKSELTLNNKKDMMINYEREIKNITFQISGTENLSFKEEDIAIIRTRIKNQEQILKEINESYIVTLTNLQNNEFKIKDLQILINKISALDKCTTCLQIVNEEHKHNIVVKATQEVRSAEAEIMKLRKDKNDNQDKIEQTRKMIDSLNQSLNQLNVLKVRLENINEKRIRIESLEKQKITILGDIDLIRRHIESLNSMLSEFSAYEPLYERKNRELKEITIKENSLMIKKAETNAQIQFLQKQIQTIEEEIKKIEELMVKLNYMKELEFWMNNKFLDFILFTEKNVMLKLREDFSKLFSNWFSTLVSDSITVRLDESFSPIIQQSDYEVEYEYLSGGERTAVALAYRLALNQTINSLLSRIKTRDIVILDEPTDGFSESQLDKMRDVLNQLNVKQLILVSHEQKIEGFVNNIIKFKKVDGTTEIEK
ncbi:MAG: AAA family ATPase [archaeon]|nr:AAA family ATPase [archaeon]